MPLFLARAMYAVADPGFSWGGRGGGNSQVGVILQIFAENCMEMKEFGPRGGGTRPWLQVTSPPLDLPMVCTRIQKTILNKKAFQ